MVALTFSAFAHADFGDSSLNWSNAQSQDFRDYVVRQFNKSGYIYNHYWSHYWLNEMYRELNLVSSKPITTTLPLVINQKTINAFAMPGNIIGIHSGLWLAADTEDELASVFAHEMAHISLDHFARLSQNSNRQSLTLASGILLSLLLAQENPDAANAAFFGSLAATNQARLTFSQAMETEADQLAQQMLIDSGYDPEAGRVFFQKLDDNSASQNALEFLRTHPLGNTRSARLSGKQSSEASTRNTVEFQLFKAMLTHNGRSLDSLMSAFSGILKDANPEDLENPNVRFASLLLEKPSNAGGIEYIDGLSALTLRHAEFLPARIELLDVLRASNDARTCPEYRVLHNELKSEFLTLDAIEVMKTTSKSCEDETYAGWHAKSLWFSGQETAAMNYIKAQLKRENSINQTAILTQMLSDYASRYERFN
jgi:Zn-dependent protease with chaperone function